MCKCMFTAHTESKNHASNGTYLFSKNKRDVSKYIESVVEELDQEKLPVLLQNKYQSLGDAMDILGDTSKISSLFIEFQKILYEERVA